MPFTLAHPAAVVPISKTDQKSLVLSALIVGSMSPDFEYFLRLRLVTKWSHTLLGVFTFCLPVSLMVLWVYHNIQKEALVLLLPDVIKNHLLPFCGGFSFLPVKHFFGICLSIVIGAFTHIIWDSFTHYNGFFVGWVGVLSVTLLSTETIQLKLYELFQDLSTFLGLLLLGFWFWRYTPASSTNLHAEFSQYSSRYKSKVVTCLALASMILAIIISMSMRPSIKFGTMRDLIRHIVVVIVPSMYIVTTIYGIRYKLYSI
jgi:hypothetical protein